MFQHPRTLFAVFAALQRRCWLERVVKWRVGCDDSLSLMWTDGDELSVLCLKLTLIWEMDGARLPVMLSPATNTRFVTAHACRGGMWCYTERVLTSGSTPADAALTRACVHEYEYACTAVYSEHFLYNLRLQRQVFYSSQERSTKLKAPIFFSFSVLIFFIARGAASRAQPLLAHHGVFLECVVWITSNLVYLRQKRGMNLSDL